MIHRFRNKLLALLLCSCLISAAVPPAAAQDEPQALSGYLAAAQTQTLTLYYKADDAAIAVLDKRTGKVWYSQLPEDQTPPDGVTDVIRAEFGSLLTVGYTLINKVTSAETVTPLEALKPAVTAKKTADGVTYTLALSDLHLTFSVAFTLAQDGLSASIPDKDIHEGEGTQALLQARRSSIETFIADTRKLAQQILAAHDAASGLQGSVKTGLSQLDAFEKTVKGIDSVVGIESVSDSLLTALDGIQTSFTGSGSKQGFFGRVAASDGIDAGTKAKYATLRTTFEDSVMPARVAISLLKTINVGSLVEVQMLPYFGACGDSAEGYVVYPNGCGAVSTFKEKHGEFATNFTSAVFSDRDTEIDWEDDSEAAGLQRTLMPYFGIRQADSAFVAYVTGGSADSEIIFSPSGYVVDVNRICAGFVYRRTVAVASSGGQWQAGQVPTAYEPERSKVDACVLYRFLSGGDANYSGMARSLNAWLVQNGQLSQSGLLQNGLPLALDFYGGYTQNVLMLKNYVTGTTFAQAEAILRQLAQNTNVPLLVNYRGYRKGGFGVTPAPNAVESKLGGLSGLRALADSLRSAGGRLFLEDDPVEAQLGQGGYTEGQLALSYKLRVLQSDDQSTYLLSPAIVKTNLLGTQAAFYKSTGASGATLDHIGTLLYDDYSEKNPARRAETVADWQAALKSLRKTLGGAAVRGGNSYVFPYVDWIQDVPETTSGYLHTDYAIPFYQMVVHGYIPYTGMAVNQFYDKDYQFLKMVEYGSLPYYTLSAAQLDADEAGVYASPYSLYAQDIVAVYNRYSKQLAGVAGSQMLSHAIDGDLVTVTYAGGTTVYINYGQSAKTVAGVTVGAMDFTVTQPKGGDGLANIEKPVGGAGEPDGVSVHHSLGDWLSVLLPLSVVLLAGAGVFVYYKRRRVHDKVRLPR